MPRQSPVDELDLLVAGRDDASPTALGGRARKRGTENGGPEERGERTLERAARSAGTSEAPVD